VRRLLAVVILAALPLSAAPSKKPKSVTIDVKDEEIHKLLKTMQSQCGIRNLVIDPGVEGHGTFVFRELPCPTAFDVVLRTMGLQASSYGAAVTRVSARR
jgi:type II secretory pathway component GspD/PulD (secretin)